MTYDSSPYFLLSLFCPRRKTFVRYSRAKKNIFKRYLSHPDQACYFLLFIRYAVKYNDFPFHSMHLYQDNNKDRYLTFCDAINQITFCQEENSSPITKSRYKIDAQLSFHFYFLDMIHFSVFMHQF